MNNNYTNEKTNAALEFAYAMGLKRPQAEEEEYSDLGFAYAMGLKRNIIKADRKHTRISRSSMVPQLRFI